MSDEFGPSFITLTDEDGNDIELEYVDALEHEGQTYMAFFPAVEDEADEESEDYGLVILKSVTENGEELLTEPMKLSYFRAPTDNDRNIRVYWDRTNIWQGENFDCVFNKVYSFKIQGNKVSFDMSSAGVSRLPFFKYTLS